MSAASVAGKAVGVILGLGVAAAAIASVFLVDWRRRPEPPPAPIRPLRVIAVGEAPPEVRTFPARVRAASEAVLAFQVVGVIQELPVARGQRVSEGDLLAQLDLRDFVSRLEAARVRVEQLEKELAAVLRAHEQDAATSMELARFRAAAETAAVERDIAAKALEDATMRAPFDGIVSDVFVDRFQKVAPGTSVLRLHGGAGIRIEVNVDATRVARSRALEATRRHSVRFDFLPGREFDASLVEFTTEADRATQTFLAIFHIDDIAEARILPGMSATVVERFVSAAEDHGGTSEATAPLSVPVEAVGADGMGRHYVWAVVPASDGVSMVRRTDVEVGEALDDCVQITGGLDRGTLIAAAGVHQLVEGQLVRPLHEGGQADAR